MADAPHLKCSVLEKNDNIKHGFFGRKGGVSGGIYNSLNCGIGSSDAPENVEKNRNIVLKTLSDNAKLYGVYQIHSNIAVEAVDDFEKRLQADAIVTNKKNVALGILTADCTPILFADAKNEVIAATHAGWGGAFDGVVENTVEKMIELGANLNNITASIGPTIAQQSYEVGAEFLERFVNQNAGYDRFFIDSKNKNHHMFNLPKFVEMKLQKCGVNKISNLDVDTYSNEEDFFSYRRSCHRNENGYGRNISVIILQ